jgi:hypothetical protein
MTVVNCPRPNQVVEELYGEAIQLFWRIEKRFQLVPGKNLHIHDPNFEFTNAKLSMQKI